MTRRASAPSAAAAALLGGAAVLHAVWATGSAWPARDRRRLAEHVAGTEEFPAPAACLTVAGLLAGAAAVVARRAPGPPARAARACVAGVFAVRGVAGMGGATGALVPWTPSPRFVELDRRFYGPLCATVAALVVAGTPRSGR
ncbi:DUF3995 domain-containing protein [Blastococcus sp. SYSU D00695]